MERYTFLFSERSDILPFPLATPWRLVSVFLSFLVMADARERELFWMRKLSEPTWIRFSFYTIWLAVALLISEALRDTTPLYELELGLLVSSWLTFWVWRATRLAVVSALGTFFCAIIDTATFPNPETLVWCLFLGFHCCSVIRAHQLLLDTPLPKRGVSRFTTPDSSPPENASYLSMQDLPPILVAQKMEL